ncbi:MAG: chemotaxis protein CheA [Desulfobacterales bacterium]|nr:chemotaxis protein CheA [Desulfobacterales bacterium]MBF0395382.1 chemotaxis protein CheA [Desulfobacterales bacterium]
MEALQSAFKEEALELIEEMISSLLLLEKNPNNLQIVNKVFRAMHTIKGSGAMFGFYKISEFTHNIEWAFDLIRNGKININKEIIDLALSATDQIRKMIDNQSDDTTVNNITSSIKKICEPKQESKESPSEPPKKLTYRIRFKPSPDIFETNPKPLSLVNELKGLGICRVSAHIDQIPDIKDLTPKKCYIFWDILLTTNRDINAIKDVFIFLENESNIKIDLIDDSSKIEEGESHSYKKLGEILIEKGVITGKALYQALGKQELLGEILIKNGAATKSEVSAALTEQKHVKEIKSAAAKEKESETSAISSIRVSSERLDKLVNLVGELVTVQDRLMQTSILKADADIISIAEEIERLASELRDHTLTIRMLPVGSIFNRFKRMVRDLSQNLGKNVELIIEGEQTELDKSVIEQLNDPLIHLIRNSIDHGIESPNERKTLGKPETGTINLIASQSGANVLIKIHDDGKGINHQKIIDKAKQKGLIDTNTDLTKEEASLLIFQPGFSTAESITDVSGRGVGLDVVKRNIESLRGSIDIQSIEGKGTTFTLKLPLTLAIIDGLLVTIETDYYVIPLTSVEECVELAQAEIEKTKGRQMLNLRGEIVPYIRLRDLFGYDGMSPSLEHIVITEVKTKKIGFVVDKVIGGHQTVIKSLGKAFKHVKDVSGATILGDGTVALILDVNNLVI